MLFDIHKSALNIVTIGFKWSVQSLFCNAVVNVCFVCLATSRAMVFEGLNLMALVMQRQIL